MAVFGRGGGGVTNMSGSYTYLSSARTFLLYTNNTLRQRRVAKLSDDGGSRRGISNSGKTKALFSRYSPDLITDDCFFFLFIKNKHTGICIHIE